MVLTSFLKGKHWGEFGEKERRCHLCEVGDSYGVCKKCLYCQRLENDWVRINELLNFTNGTDIEHHALVIIKASLFKSLCTL